MSGLKNSTTMSDTDAATPDFLSQLLGLGVVDEDPGPIAPPLPFLPALPQLVDKAAQVRASDKLLRANRGVLKRTMLGGSTGSASSVTNTTLIGS